MTQVLGIDIGGSEIKAAPVNVSTGRLTDAAHRLPTPEPSTPTAVGNVAAQMTQHFGWTGSIGCAFPAPIIDSVVRYSGNLDKAWVGCDGETFLASATGLDVALLNDADAAGIAEMRFGAGRYHHGTVLVLTFGTGIGSSLFINGCLVPNTELGILLLENGIAEEFAAARTLLDERLTDREWAARVSFFVNHLETLFYPNLIVVGGGISSRWSDFADELDVQVPVVPAKLLGDAGIAGAAMFAADRVAARLAMREEHVSIEM
jgi:polyphosphate glucokinase